MVPHEADAKMETCMQEVYWMVHGEARAVGKWRRTQLWCSNNTGSQFHGGIGFGAWMALLKCPASRLRGRAHITPFIPVTRCGLALTGGCLQVTAIFREGPIWELPATNISSSRQRGDEGQPGHWHTPLCPWELDYEESCAQKNRCFWTVVLEKTLESPLDCKEIQPVHPKGNQSWVFIWRTDVEAGTPIFWTPDAKSWLLWKDSDTGKDWRQEEKGTTEDEMAGWHHQLNGHEFR